MTLLLGPKVRIVRRRFRAKIKWLCPFFTQPVPERNRSNSLSNQLIQIRSREVVTSLLGSDEFLEPCYLCVVLVVGCILEIGIQVPCFDDVC